MTLMEHGSHQEPHAKKDKHDAHRRLVMRLRDQAHEMRRLVSGLDEAALAKRTVPDKWSLKELVGHLRGVQRVFEGRVNAILAEDNPLIAKYTPEQDAEFDRMVSQSAEELLTGFFDERAILASRLEALSPAQWHRSGRHPEFQHFDVHFQVEYMVHHEAHHIYQMLLRRLPLGKLPH